MNPAAVDVLVVGCGPAGASAAAAAASRGLSVLIVERRRQVGQPVQCAEFVPLPLAGLAQSTQAVRQPIRGMNTCLPSGSWVYADLPGLMIDRAVFDQALAARAVAAGAQLSTGTVLAALDAASHGAIVEDGGGARTIVYRLLIAADGPHSAVARLLGLPPLASLLTRQYTVPLSASWPDTDVWLSDAYPGGYAWLFPRGRRAHVGVGLTGSARQMKGVLDALHDSLVKAGRVASTVLRRTGGAIPVAGLRPRLAVGRVLFAGDAAGLTHPVTGAGIAAAVASGEYAGQAAAAWLAGRSRALEAYEAELRDVFGASLARAVARRQALWQATRRTDAEFRRAWAAFPEYFQAPWASHAAPQGVAFAS
ncbi:NAD(P)/FAD-dependent oxidoreductase [Thiobacter aerophilum]|uniref:NAD(P)/FAD-dependent oxidoreductase n=1 Tax=Thiobacter aerophilum TaxID=3121275 RepID=A0ABV0EF87_9BURK